MLNSLFFRFLGFAEAHVVSAHQSGQQEHGGKLHADQVRTIQGHPNFLRSYRSGAEARSAASHQVND
ncbi:MAG: hypothetical protein WA463_06195, partial [Terriglobales bacterium]